MYKTKYDRNDRQRNESLITKTVNKFPYLSVVAGS